MHQAYSKQMVLDYEQQIEYHKSYGVLDLPVLSDCINRGEIEFSSFKFLTTEHAKNNVSHIFIGSFNSNEDLTFGNNIHLEIISDSNNYINDFKTYSAGSIPEIFYAETKLYEKKIYIDNVNIKIFYKDNNINIFLQNHKILELYHPDLYVENIRFISSYNHVYGKVRVEKAFLEQCGQEREINLKEEL